MKLGEADPLQLFQAGFHGAALVFLVLGYYLLRKVLAEKPGAAAAAQNTFRMKLRAVWGFLWFAFLFFVAGVAFQIWGPRIGRGSSDPLVVQLSPSEMPAGLPSPLVYLAGDPLQFGASGRAEATIETKRDLMINTLKLSQAIDARIRSAEIQQAASTPGVGIGDDPAAQEVGLTDDVLATATPAQVEAKVEELKEKVENPAPGEDPAAARASLGWVYYSLGRDEEAKATLELAAKEADDPKTKARVSQNLSRVLEMQGDLKGAKKVLLDTKIGRERVQALGRVEAAAVPPG